MKTFWQTIALLSLFLMGAASHSFSQGLYITPTSPTLLEQNAWLRFWQATYESSLPKESRTEERSIGGSAAEMDEFFWLGRFRVDFAPIIGRHPLKHEIVPTYTSDIPDSLILLVDMSQLSDDPVERLAFLQDGLVLDSVWLSSYDYFQTWSSQEVNPYTVKASDLPDSVCFDLYDLTKDKQWSPPLDTAIINSPFGFRRWRNHNGIDLDLERGDLVRATFAGVVRVSRYDRSGFGHHLVIRHQNGLETLYAHLSERFVTPGMYVEAGQIIGTGGSTGRSTGPHLHFEVRYQGIPINPEEIFDFKANALREAKYQMDLRTFKRKGYFSGGAYTLTSGKGSGQVYQVRSGDSLWTISRRYGTTIDKLCALNGLTRRSTLRIGQKLRLP
ncbi:MAG: peptidoglycan DD-metalloendopeptidase family protein [Bernardetiaceae bacterium]